MMKRILPDIRHACSSIRSRPKPTSLSCVARGNERPFSNLVARKKDAELHSSDHIESSFGDGQPKNSWPERQQNIDEESAEATARAICTKADVEPRKYNRNLELSEDAHRLYGLGDMRLDFKVPDFSDTLTDTPELSRILATKLEEAIRLSEHRGLSALATGMAQISREGSLGTALLVYGRRRSDPRGHYVFKAVLGEDANFRFNLSPRHNIKIRLAEGSSERAVSCKFRLIIYAQANAEPQPLSAVTSNTLLAEDEIAFLFRTAAMVLSRLCSSMQYATLELAVSTIAQALQRVMQFRTPYLTLTKTLLVARPSEGTKLGVSVSWRVGANTDTTSSRNSKREVDTTIMKTAKTEGLKSPAPKRISDVAGSAFANTKEAFIALGSNMGDRLAAVEAACREIDLDESIEMLETSPLYETDAMYVESQEAFINGVCKLRTNLRPLHLLDRLQAIEKKLGRVKSIDKGPRNIDLDILTHGHHVIRTKRLTVPHALMHEREFVLRPLSQTSGRFMQLPSNGQRVLELFKALPQSRSAMYPVTPLAPGCESLRPLAPQRRTAVMSILNITPDSFSDGGDNHTVELDALKHTVASHIASGATIIDVGGQSSRPNAPDITAEEELSRILPAIEAIKSLPESTKIAISIDTYRASVAEAAIRAGAHIINDISAGSLDPDMLPTIAKLGCTYIMMHMRGTPSTMQQHTSYPSGVLLTIGDELSKRLRLAEKAGIRRWRIILDPGIGFAKTDEQNAEILAGFAKLRKYPGLSTYPWLVGSSRKGFIGRFTDVKDAKDRVEGTAATVTAAIAGGAEIVRVHDVEEMSRVVKMADAMYRSGKV